MTLSVVTDIFHILRVLFSLSTKGSSSCGCQTMSPSSPFRPWPKTQLHIQSRRLLVPFRVTARAQTVGAIQGNSTSAVRPDLEFSRPYL